MRLKVCFIPMMILIMIIAFVYSHGHGHIDENQIHESTFFKMLMNYLKDFSKVQQANIGAFIISTAPVPIFFLILLFKIENMKVLDIMSSFASGALIGDVFIHNIPEIFEHKHHHNEHSHKTSSYSYIIELISKNEIMICWGVFALFIAEKILNFYSKSSHVHDKKEEHEHEHHHHNHDHSHKNMTNIMIALSGDFLHNITDGLGIGAGFNKSLKLGISLSLSIFLHEIPHEIGDFSYLLKQKMSISNALLSQFLAALGAFFGVYITSLFGDIYSDKILSFSSGAFLYLAINTILGDLKKSESLIQILLEGIAFISGALLLQILL